MIYLYLRIPKTGSETLRHYVHMNYRHHGKIMINVVTGDASLLQCCWYSLILAKHRALDLLCINSAVEGHFNVSMHPLLCGSVRNYITLVRHPVSRVYSWYHHYLYYEGKRYYTPLQEHERQLGMFMTKGLPETDNGMVRRLSGIGAKVPFGCVTDKHFNKALENVRQRFLFVGLFERYTESLEQIARIANWHRCDFTAHLNQNKSSLYKNSVIEKDEYNLIESKNYFDMRLYEAVQAMFW